MANMPLRRVKFDGNKKSATLKSCGFFFIYKFPRKRGLLTVGIYLFNKNFLVTYYINALLKTCSSIGSVNVLANKNTVGGVNVNELLDS